MTLKGKQKQFLRSLAVELPPILQVGKSGVTATIVKQAADALLARELLKGRVLQASPVDVPDVAQELAAARRRSWYR